MLKQAHGDDTVTLKTVYAWFKKFSVGREKFSVGHRSGRPIKANNARPHTATLVKRFLPQYGVTELSHPPYSPDLSPVDFFLFPKLKMALKGRKFTDIMHIQAVMTPELKLHQWRSLQELSTICTRVVTEVHSV
ncbi:hypothetical protein AVEN_35363-1 [Araneus ventricosus]|uniref:Mos1 transposase HTH domain-containing protein n=1 Tax=Araneus ventricosus TaxID=182803 RepID=A0A4Y1ZTF5_ARAVE|nr:hypothetical protein AVEN_35363-1 [Araneus ventricosus]